MYTQQHIPIISGRWGKKRKGKRVKERKKRAAMNGAEEYVIPFEIEPIHKIVTIKPLLLHWSFSKSLWPKKGFDIDVKKTVGTLKRIIARRHGSVESIKLWKIVKAPQNLLEDDRMTLADCGFVGRGKEVVKSPLAHLVKGPPTKVAGSDDEMKVKPPMYKMKNKMGVIRTIMKKIMTVKRQIKMRKRKKMMIQVLYESFMTLSQELSRVPCSSCLHEVIRHMSKHICNLVPGYFVI